MTAVRTPSTGVDTLTLRYPDGPHDSEALMVDPRSGDLYVVVKHLAGGPAAVYRAPAGLRAGLNDRARAASAPSHSGSAR